MSVCSYETSYQTFEAFNSFVSGDAEAFRGFLADSVEFTIENQVARDPDSVIEVFKGVMDRLGAFAVNPWETVENGYTAHLMCKNVVLYCDIRTTPNCKIRSINCVAGECIGLKE